MTTRRLLLALALVPACTRGTHDAAPPLDQPPPEPPPVLAEVAPPPAPPPEPTPEPPPGPTLDLLGAAREAGDLTTFLALVDEAGLKDSLSAPGARTVFAPSDAAFAALPKGELDRLRKNKKKLAALLGHHVVPGTNLTAADLAARPADAPPLRTLGADLQPPPLERPDLATTNGVLHIVPAVLQPGKPSKPTEPATKPADVKPATKPADVKPATKPADKPTEPATKPTDVKPTEPATKSPDVKPTDTKPPTPAKPTQAS